MFLHPGKKLLFMGGEFGVWREWDHDASLEWDLLQYPAHTGIQRCVADLNVLYRQERALYEVDFEPSGFEWVDCNDHQSSVISLLRRARDPHDFLAGVLNWTPVVRAQYRVGVPESGFYREVLNTDSALYGGSNAGNQGGVHTEPIPAHGHAQSLRLTLPPLSALVFKREPGQLTG